MSFTPQNRVAPDGDARSLLNALELAVETTPADAAGIIHVTLAVAEESIQQRAVLYDKEGDAHFDTISAFIKSVRGSDPDAALYWLAKMVYAGEDPRFILRRLLILACEDIGQADPQAVVVINACASAFDRVGMPEGRYHLAQATLYLATAPKSNSTMGFFDALAAVEKENVADVPSHLKDANRDKKGFGHGEGYLYPHAYRDHWVAQQYLPASMQGQVFYQPSMQGFEAEINTQVALRREAQLAALQEGVGYWPVEVVSSSPSDRTSDRWLQRTLNQVGERLALVRERIFELAQLQRHHVVLDLDASSGLLTWSALRRTPEGGVYACVHTQVEADALLEQAAALPQLTRPTVLTAKLSELSLVLANQLPKLQFDRIIGRNALLTVADKVTTIEYLLRLLKPSGVLVLAEAVPRHTQRLYQLLDRAKHDSHLYERLVAAEEAIYATGSDSMVNWDAADLRLAFEAAGMVAQMTIERSTTQMYITSALIERWFALATATEQQRPTYAQHLARFLNDAEIQAVKDIFTRFLLHQTVTWASTIAFIQAKAAK